MFILERYMQIFSHIFGKILSKVTVLMQTFVDARPKPAMAGKA